MEKRGVKRGVKDGGRRFFDSIVAIQLATLRSSREVQQWNALILFIPLCLLRLIMPK
jgi:hypothetical protein